MRLLRKLFIKFITFAVLVVVIGAAARFARPYIMKSAGVPDGIPSVAGATPHFGSEESDLMATVFKSALRLFTGQAKREELAGELSDKLYANRGASATMSELGIELEKPGAKPSDPAASAKANANSVTSVAATSPANVQPDPKSPAKSAPQVATQPAKDAPYPVRTALLSRLMEKAKLNPELTLIPFVLLGMFGFHLFRRRKSPVDDLMMPDFSKLIPTEADDYTMTHPVHSLTGEDFELLVALIYQRQGYRVTMPAGLSGGRGGDFMVQRKSERLLVQCKKLNPDDKVHVDRVRELQESAAACGATRGVYVACCGFSWDARNFAKTKGVTVINAKTLDLLLNEARETPDEDFLAVSHWAPKLMTKVKLTPPLCPACEASMDELTVSSGPVWLCSQRPDCRGRRIARKQHKPLPAGVVASAAPVSAKPKPHRPATSLLPAQPPSPPSTRGGRARTICPATA
jgi:Restriction endonuclease